MFDLMISKLPEELVKKILHNNSVVDEFSMSSTNSINKALFLEDLKKKLLSIKKLQLFYKKNLPRFLDISNNSGYYHSAKYTCKKNHLIRIYIANYPVKYLLSYPEFLVKKISRFSENIEIKNILSGLPPANNRTRRNIRNFLLCPLITTDDIMYGGW